MSCRCREARTPKHVAAAAALRRSPKNLPLPPPTTSHRAPAAASTTTAPPVRHTPTSTSRHTRSPSPLATPSVTPPRPIPAANQYRRNNVSRKPATPARRPQPLPVRSLSPPPEKQKPSLPRLRNHFAARPSPRPLQPPPGPSRRPAPPPPPPPRRAWRLPSAAVVSNALSGPRARPVPRRSAAGYARPGGVRPRPSSRATWAMAHTGSDDASSLAGVKYLYASGCRGGATLQR